MSSQNILSKNVAVLSGGWSDEREISLQSGTACAEALQEAGFERVELLDVAAPDFIEKLTHGGYDVAFVAMHGRYGEDGCIQGLLEILHMPYTFSGVLASATGTQKDAAKRVYREAGIPVPEGKVVDHELSAEEADHIVYELGLPLFVKPASNGSSYGITRVTKEEDLAQAVITADVAINKVLIEQCVEGMEITVPVIGNDEDAQALPIIEIVTGSDFYDSKVKYEPSELHHVIPARIDETTAKLARKYAVKAHRALGCRGTSRSDFIVQSDGVPVLLETNTIPGMTKSSLLPDAARHAGIEFPELCRRFVEMALGEVSD